MNLRHLAGRLRPATALLGAVLLTGIGLGPARAPTAPAAAAYVAVCGAAAPGHAQCDAVRHVAEAGQTAAANATAVPAPPAGAYGPSDLLSAYKLPTGRGAGQTVAVIDAYNDPTVAADLAVYRSSYGLPACTSANGCFSVYNENGGTTLPPTDDGWASEESLDVDMVSAICSLCHIMLVEASSTSYADLGTAVNEAVALGAKFISNSYGGPEQSSDTTLDTEYFDHPGVVITASAGDSGYAVQYPASSPYVTAVGGTTLTKASNARGWAETAWDGTGAGCSAYEPKPSWQHDTGCAHRTVADVSADADPNTGVAVYDTSTSTDPGWNEFGGTSVASPIIASIYALTGTPVPGSNPAESPYQHSAGLFDVTSGSDGSCGSTYLCTAGSGYDGPTGLGTPDGSSAFNGGKTADLLTQSGGVWTAELSNGSSFQSAGTWLDGLTSDWAALGDVNGDGKADLVLHDPANETYYVALGQSGGGFGTPEPWLTGWGTGVWAGLADLNGDGKADLLVGNSDASWAEALSNGNSFTGEGIVLTGWGAGDWTGLADVTGDGAADLVVHNPTTEAYDVSVNNGQGQFGAAGTGHWLTGATGSPIALLGNLNGS